MATLLAPYAPPLGQALARPLPVNLVRASWSNLWFVAPYLVSS